MRGIGKSRLCFLCLTCLLQGLNALPVAQNPMEAMGVGIMTAVSSIGEIISNGAAARKEHGIKSEFFEINSKSEVGMGQAIKPPTTSDESDEDRRRRKRSTNVIIGEEQLLPLETDAAAYPHIHRNKRSPCRFGSAGTGGAGGVGGSGGTGGSPDPVADGTDYIDGAERRRRQRKRKAAQQRKKSQGGTNAKSGKQEANKKGTKKQRTVVTRRRRQANEGAGLENQFGQKAQQFAQRVQSAVDSFMGTMVQVAQTVQKTFSGPSGGQQQQQGGYQ